jgi:hypothetical protein
VCSCWPCSGALGEAFISIGIGATGIGIGLGEVVAALVLLLPLATADFALAALAIVTAVWLGVDAYELVWRREARAQARSVLASSLARRRMEARGIEPLLQPCKGRVLPLPLRPRAQDSLRRTHKAPVRRATSAAVVALMSTVSRMSSA